MSEGVVIGRVVSVNVGKPRKVAWYGRKVTTAIWKDPVAGAVAVSGVNAAGDQQADRRVHGGYDKAIYAYAAEDYLWWSRQLGLPADALGPGSFGDNLTTEGVDLGRAAVGERWLVGSVTLEVSEPRLPCYKLGLRMGDSGFVDRFDEACRFGTYLRIVGEGEVSAGAQILRLPAGAGDGARAGDGAGAGGGGLTIGDLVEAHHRPTPALLGRIAASRQVPEPWRAMAERALRRQQAHPGP